MILRTILWYLWTWWWFFNFSLLFIDLFKNVVTFRKTDSSLRLPPFDFGYDGDIYFEFKTTIENGILVNAKGPESDEIRIELRGKFTLLYTKFISNKKEN